MANVVVVGSQWGDEGKGKIVDWLSERDYLLLQPNLDAQKWHRVGKGLLDFQVGQPCIGPHLVEKGSRIRARPSECSVDAFGRDQNRTAHIVRFGHGQQLGPDRLMVVERHEFVEGRYHDLLTSHAVRIELAGRLSAIA